GGRADARRDARAALHEGRVAVRAQARRLPRAGGARRRGGAAHHPQRARHRGDLPGDRARPRGASLRRRDSRWRAGRARRRGPAQLPAAPEPRPSEPRARRAPGCRRDAGGAVRVRPAGPRGVRPAAAAARAPQGRARAHRAARGTDQIPRALRDRRRGAVRPGGEARSRGDRREEGGCTVPRRPSPNWLKIRADRTDDFAVVGFTRPKGSRSGFGALDLGAYRDGKLAYAGRVGSGFTAAQLNDVSAALEQGIRPKPAFAGPAPQDPGHTWVEPTLVAEVRYKEWTDEGLLRQPVFVRFRDDKPVTECVMPGDGKRETRNESGPTFPVSPVPFPEDQREVRFSNLEKVFGP